MTLLDRHIAFLDALRAAGLPVSLSEGLDAIDGLSAVGWSERSLVRDVYAATLVKRASYRATFDELFELYFPHTVGSGAGSLAADSGGTPEASSSAATPAEESPEKELGEEVAPESTPDDPDAALATLREAALATMSTGDPDAMRALAAAAMAGQGSMPGRGPGLSSWSSYTALRRLDVSELVERLVRSLMEQGWTEEEAERTARRRGQSLTGLIEADAHRRIAEEKGPEHMAKVGVRPTIESLPFLAMRRADVDELRREVYPLARRLATRLARQQRSLRRGPVDMRRTLRASLSTGGVPVRLHRRPRRPRRPELVVLCDVSGSVSNFATFTLLLLSALQEAFTAVRSFTFVDTVTEVTQEFRAGDDIGDTMARLVERSAFAARLGRTNYGNAFRDLLRDHGDALTPKTTLLILGDARSNYSDLHRDALIELVGRSRHAYWLNPEVRRQWDTGDSEASAYGTVVEMHECRNLTQLAEFISRLD